MSNSTSNSYFSWKISIFSLNWQVCSLPDCGSASTCQTSVFLLCSIQGGTSHCLLLCCLWCTWFYIDTTALVTVVHSVRLGHIHINESYLINPIYSSFSLVAHTWTYWMVSNSMMVPPCPWVQPSSSLRESHSKPSWSQHPPWLWNILKVFLYWSQISSFRPHCWSDFTF